MGLKLERERNGYEGNFDWKKNISREGEGEEARNQFSFIKADRMVDVILSAFPSNTAVGVQRRVHHVESSLLGLLASLE